MTNDINSKKNNIEKPKLKGPLPAIFGAIILGLSIYSLIEYPPEMMGSIPAQIGIVLGSGVIPFIGLCLLIGGILNMKKANQKKNE